MTAVRRLFFLLVYLSWAWHCWSLKLGTPLGQGKFSHTVCSTLAPRQFFPPGPGLSHKRQTKVSRNSVATHRHTFTEVFLSKAILK